MSSQASARTGLSPAEEAFLSYDWAKSAKWQAYLDSLYPTPPLNKMMKWKKKFFKTHEDPTFVPDSPALAAALNEEDPSNAQQSHTQPPSSGTSGNVPTYSYSQPSQRFSPPARRSFLRSKLLPPLCAVGLVVGVILSLLSVFTPRQDSEPSTRPGLTGSSVLFVSFLLHVYIVLGGPPVRFSNFTESISTNLPPYVQQALHLDAAHAIFYLLFTASMPPSLPVTLSPAISALLVFSTLMGEGDGIPVVVKTNSLVLKAITKVQMNRMLLMQQRADVEVFFGVFFIVSRILTLNFSVSHSIIPIFLYFHLFRIRYSTCGFTHTTFRRIDAFISGLVYKPMCPPFVASLYRRVQTLCKALVNPQTTSPTAAAQQRCVIQ
ncbi:family UPF0121 protein [Toxoplasma gondii TgCatPRC2]|uniref:Family UPF0121 protein n=3 Tax=Toxoplasma gondii TaxID=5811 RepID=A0A151HNN0_TOXGO|nr:hypothetical protein TGME49_270270 [Toxoplasma gondii ME49]EPT28406.1 hypothetical protein TGME49_270270 [Toxoplasma gondii ME49]KYF46728.1 family UPF0121 protein [Toxoplasma gondii ARI]KYK71019.1 family UPF0121 protein [Toxoplasma gondii TgCatPRC2]|eukprot:XP_002365703.1 hypothetical protein TGME49_270270 [Toxoplasma gondii ME49]